MAALLLIFATMLFVQIVAAAKIPFITYGNGQETCLSTEQRNIALQKMKNNVYQYLFNRNVLPQCGEGIWYRVAYLNMTDPSQQCPSAWREYNTNQFRACGRPVSSGASRPFQTFQLLVPNNSSKPCIDFFRKTDAADHEFCGNMLQCKHKSYRVVKAVQGYYSST
ncbi:MAG: hypothetical protein MJE68_17385 [Proteobacteria bacterium]|nr:hypothetical protein [Pseudomonadota bacterium]